MNHLHNAIRKCHHEYKYTWSGALIPKEILALRDLGVHIDPRDEEIAIDWKRRGENARRWIFFTVDKNSGVQKKFEILFEGVNRNE